MRRVDGTTWLSPSDLSAHLGCTHATALALADLDRGGSPPRLASDYLDLLVRKGNEHERAYLAGLRAAGREVVEIERGDWARGARQTREAMQRGAEVIYQGVLVRDDGWRGIADFLERVDRPTALGSWGYEAVDTKLARAEAAPRHVLQLAVYSAALAELQGREPERMHLELGSGQRTTIPVRDAAPYARRAATRLRAAIEERPGTEAYPCAHCELCDYRPACAAGWRAADHLTFVAGIRRDHVDALRAAGVDTLAALGALPATATVAGIRPEPLAGLREQAALQVEARATGSVPFVLRPHVPGRGFDLLPRPAALDVVFDLEGDPFWRASRELTFLFGLLLRDGDGWTYEAVWAHDVASERDALAAVVDCIHDRLARDPGMHVYHYSPAEPSAITRMMSLHAVREEEIDALLRRGVLVDLLAVVRQGLRAGVESYSLKAIEGLAGYVRAASMGSGAEAVLGYERWLASADDGELGAIAAYNEDDCRATAAVLDWLLALRPPAARWREPGAQPPVKPETVERDAGRERLVRALVDGYEAGSPERLAGLLVGYHQREARPGWWRYFQRCAAEEDELVEDREAVAGLVPSGDPVPDGQSLLHALVHPAQEHRFAGGQKAVDPATGKRVAVAEVDVDARRLVIRRGATRVSEPLPAALIPRGPFDTTGQRAALELLARSILDDTGAYPALEAILRREPPHLTGHAPGAPLQTTALAEQRALASALDRSTLVVQGPPGTGKTYTGARLVTHLLGQGARVGVTAFSHAAIDNLLAAIVDAAAAEGVAFAGARHGARAWPPEGTAGPITRRDKPFADRACQLVGATTWGFVGEPARGAFDVLVIDEAGQLSLADALAAGTAATSLILLGDPQQLPQVSQGTHADGSSASVLEHLLAGAPTIPAERGLFLAETRRMHPAIAGFISEQLYEGRLTAHPDCALQACAAGTGIRFAPVQHAGRSTAAPEEADWIAAEIDRLVGTPVVDGLLEHRLLRACDVMVVAPYNDHVRLLRRTLPADVRVGTVDSFQGQEALVVFFSMATSSDADLPRDVGFLFSRNRLNVAISRARLLAYLVASPRLLDARAADLDDIRLISTLCALVEEAERQAATSV